MKIIECKKLIRQGKLKSQFRKDCRCSEYLTIVNKNIAFLCIDTLCLVNTETLKFLTFIIEVVELEGLIQKTTLIRHVDTVYMYQMIRRTVREKDND